MQVRKNEGLCGRVLLTAKRCTSLLLSYIYIFQNHIVTAKIAGPSVPPGRIFGSGTCLDSSRLRSLIGRTLDISGQSVHGYIIGEHGDSSVPVWSSVRIGGVPFVNPEEGPSEVHHAMHREVVQSALEVIKRKGYTNWSVGLANAYIAEIVLNDGRK